eukprot:581572-Hanusia_phi.AAC.1
MNEIRRIIGSFFLPFKFEHRQNPLGINLLQCPDAKDFADFVVSDISIRFLAVAINPCDILKILSRTRGAIAGMISSAERRDDLQDQGYIDSRCEEGMNQTQDLFYVSRSNDLQDPTINNNTTESPWSSSEGKTS